MGLAIFIVIAFVFLGVQHAVAAYRRSHPVADRGVPNA
jgi:hypothetical protein